MWSLLLSLCLASLTHAHRSHTGRCLYVFAPAGRVALASRFPRRGLRFLFTCRRFGVNRLRATRGNADVAFKEGSKDHRGWLPRTHEKFFNIRKESMSNPVRKVLSVQGHSRLFSHRGWRHSRMPPGYSDDGVRRAVWIRNPRLRDTRPVCSKWVSHQ